MLLSRTCSERSGGRASPWRGTRVSSTCAAPRASRSSALFGPTTSADGFWCHEGTVLEAPLPCRPCSRHGRATCPMRDHLCMQSLAVDAVLSAARALRLMSYLLVTQDFPPGFIGGIAAWATDLASALHAAGHDVTVLCRNTKHSRGPDSRQPYRIVRMVGRSWSRFQGTWARLHARRFLAPDVHVLTATWKLATELVGPCENKGASLSVAFHGSDLTQVEGPAKGLTEVARRCEAVASGLAASSRASSRDSSPRRPAIRACRSSRCRFRFPPRRRWGRASGLLSVTRLTPLKGVDRAIRLAAELGEPLTVVGDGTEKDALPDGPHVTWAGRKTRDELAQMYARAKGVVLLPRATEDGTGAEGLGLCLLEAAAQGAIPIGCRDRRRRGGGGPRHRARRSRSLRRRTRSAGSSTIRRSRAKCHAFVASTHGAERTLQVLTRP